MITVGDNPEGQLLAFALAWFRLLSRAEWEAALGMIDEPGSYGIRWTRDMITSLLEDTFAPATHFAAEFGPPAFSDPDSAKGNPHPSFGRLKAGKFWLDHVVPLNGVSIATGRPDAGR